MCRVCRVINVHLLRVWRDRLACVGSALDIVHAGLELREGALIDHWYYAVETA